MEPAISVQAGGNKILVTTGGEETFKNVKLSGDQQCGYVFIVNKIAGLKL